MINLAGISIFVGAEAIRIVSEIPRLCCSCRKPKTMFVNRGGQTRCDACDKHAVDDGRGVAFGLLAIVAMIAGMGISEYLGWL